MIEIDLVKIQSTDVGSTASVVTFQLLGFGSSNNDSGAETLPGIEYVQPIGFAARPVPSTNCEALVIRRGDEVLALFALDKGQQAGGSPALADIVQGETRMYGAATPDSTIKIKSNGDITIIPKSGQVVSLGDVPSTTKYPIGDGEVLRQWCISVEQAVNGLITDMIAVKTHLHPASSGTTSASLTLTTVGAETSTTDPPALSTKVKLI